MKNSKPLDKLKHHVTGAIERGEKTAIEGIPVMKHTSGPWIVRKTSTKSYLVQAGDSFSSNGGFSKEFENEANARLIAAAPELLEALKLVFDSTAVLNHLGRDSIDFLKKVIAKAEGNES